MKIYVDADACPVVAIVEQIAKEYEIPVTLLCDTNHVLYSDYSEVVTVGAGADAVDFKLVSLCHKGDIVVTQDYGVAAMILGKGAYGIHQNGKWYTNENIDRMLMERHLAKKARNAKKKHHLKGPSKRTDEDDRRFAESFTRLVEKRLKTENETEERGESSRLRYKNPSQRSEGRGSRIFGEGLCCTGADHVSFGMSIRLLVYGIFPDRTSS